MGRKIFWVAFGILLCVPFAVPSSGQTQSPDLPRVYIEGVLIETNVVMVDSILFPNGSQLRIESPFPNGHIVATGDGTKPTLLLPEYNGQPFWMIGGQTLRVVAYSSDYSRGGDEVRIDFVNLPVFQINLSYAGSGAVSTPPFNGLRHSSNTVVRMTPLPSPGWAFERWSGDFESTDPALVFTITKDVSVRAHFVPAGVTVSARRVQNEILLLRFSALVELDYHVQSSMDLSDWGTTKTLTQRAGVVDAFVQLDPAGAKFFRVVSTPRGQPAT